MSYLIDGGLEEPSGLMSAKTYWEKVVKSFPNKIWGAVNLLVTRAKSCFMKLRKVQQILYTVKEENAYLRWECKKLKEKQRYQKEQYKELDRENNELREDSRKLNYFKEYLPGKVYDEIVNMAERQCERQKNREKFY